MEKDNKKTTKNKSTSSKTKQTSTKKVSSNTSTKKTQNNIKKDNNNINKVKVEKKKKIFTKDNLLLAIFIFLVFLVVFLGVKVAQKYNKEKDIIKANITIPLMKKDDKAVVEIDLNELSKQDEYVFKITNYRNEELITENIPYKITVLNETDTTIELKRDKINNNLITNQKETVIDSLRLYKDKKEEIYFHVRILKKGNIKPKEVVKIIVES